MNWDEAFKRVIGFEGDYVNHPSDPGGETKFGISKRAYPDLNIAGLTVEDAKSIYKRDYWDKLRLDELPDNIRYAVFDCAVNSGIGTAVKLLQRACGTMDDGALGPKTIQAANAAKDLAARYAVARLLFLTDLKPFDTFGRGWTRRVAQVLLDSL